MEQLKKILILDLDENLIHCHPTTNNDNIYDFCFKFRC